MSAPAVALTALALLSSGTAAQSDDADAINPCNDQFLQLKCPDLRMAPPSDLSVVKAGKRVRLRATNRIVNVGQGPLELRGERTKNPDFAKAYQVVYSRNPQRPVVFFPEAGWIYWKAVPGQGHYWKYFRAARFELWTLNPDGTRAKLRRVGPKLSYCFRDLRRVRRYHRTPRGRIYPGCSQDFGRKHLRLGVSPGWADIYPSTYHENWISITGLKGCFAFVHRADPTGELVEQDNDNNIGERIIRLPPRHGRVAPRGCPQAR
jgi:hypothetical protein